jgi:hypothetical protein
MRRRNRRAALTVVGAAIAAALPVTVEATDSDISLTSEVDGYCSFDAAPSFPSITNVAPSALTPTSSLITISTPTDSGGMMQFWKFSLKIDGTCNIVGDLRLTSEKGGLKDPAHGAGPPPTGFIKRFDYFASVDFDGAGPVSIPTTAGTPVSSSPSPEYTTGPYSGEATLHVTGVVNSAGPLLAGSYTDVLTISLIPQ